MAASAGSLLDRLRSGDWLDRERVAGYARVLLVLELVTFLFFIAGTHGLVVPLESATSTDFVSFYAAGNLANAGHPELAYDQAAHYAAEQAATEPGIPYQFFFYPPVFLILCSIFARLPYLTGFVLFEAASLLAFLSVARRILGESGWSAWLPVLAFPSIFWTLGLGQNAFLTAALFGGAILLVDRRPAWAGILIGALCYKPHFGLLIPIALVAGRHWRAVAAAGATVLALVLLSVLLFGWDSWAAFIDAAAGSHATYESGRIDFAGLVSPFAAARLMGGSPLAAYLVQATATLAAAIFVIIVWRRGLDLATRGASLLAATLFAVPVVLIYDLMLGLVAGLWLIRAGRAGGFLPWEKTVLFGLFGIPLLARNIGAAWHVPLASIACAMLLALIAVRARHEARQRGDAEEAALDGQRVQENFGS